ncbi:hypothetical protein EMCRGX_G010478 [Ephydatia muelleri]
MKKALEVAQGVEAGGATTKHMHVETPGVHAVEPVVKDILQNNIISVLPPPCSRCGEIGHWASECKFIQGHWIHVTLEGVALDRGHWIHVTLEGVALDRGHWIHVTLEGVALDRGHWIHVTLEGVALDRGHWIHMTLGGVALDRGHWIHVTLGGVALDRGHWIHVTLEGVALDRGHWIHVTLSNTLITHWESPWKSITPVLSLPWILLQRSICFHHKH